MEIPQHKVFWYTLKPLEKIPPLMDDIMVDVAVIGGGMTGLSAVQRLREAGATVVDDFGDIPGAVKGHVQLMDTVRIAISS